MASGDVFFSEYWHQTGPQRVALRQDVGAHKQRYQGELWYLLRDPLRNRYIRLRPEAYRFLMLLDGRRTVQDVWQQLWEKAPLDAPSQEEVIQMIARLNQQGLLVTEQNRAAGQVFEQGEETRGRELRGRLLNFLFLRIPLWDPDRTLQALLPLARVLFTRWMAVAWLALVGTGIFVALSHAEALLRQTEGVIAPGNLLWLYLVWAVVKFLHEMGHGIACRRWGGEVHTMGIMLLVMTPIPYVDTTSSHALRERYRRLLVGSAGILVELALAAVAVILWAQTGEGLLRQIAYNVVFLASVSTLLFNLNPLLRFDGYYILTDLLDYPNLHQRSTMQLKYWLERYGFGLRTSMTPAASGKEAVGLTFFAISSAIYRIFILTVIIGFVAGQFFEIGLLLALFAIITWGLVPVGKFFKYVHTGKSLVRCRTRATTVTWAALAALLLLLGAMPFPHAFRAEGVVEVRKKATVVSLADGFVQDLAVAPGQWVENNQPLLQLVDPELDLDRKRLAAAGVELAARQRAAQEREPAFLTALASQTAQLELRQARLAERAAGLTVAAPQEGRWVPSATTPLTGRWLPRGTELGKVLDDRERSFTAIVTQAEADRLFRHELEGAVIRLRGDAGLPLTATGLDLLPAEQTRLPTAALGWLAGGKIPVAAGDPESVTTVEPFFVVKLSLPESEALALGSFRRGVARFSLPARPLFWQWWARLRFLLQERYRL